MKPLLFVLILAFCCLAVLPRHSAAQDKDGIYIIFDASGSMWGELPDKSRKVTVAKQVLEDFVAGDFEGYDLALRAYGHRRKGDCSDTELVAPFGAPEQVIDKVKAFTKDLNPLGKTPISHGEDRFEVTSHKRNVVESGTSRFGRGGMHSKLAVARKTAALGTEVVIANGLAGDILVSLANGGGTGTRFPAGSDTSPAKRWLASSDGHAVGAVHVNPGAEQALLDRNRLASLLPVGIERLEGDFRRGDVIGIVSPSGRVLGCGRAQYDRAEAEENIGRQGKKPLIHYDYLYLTD